MAHPAWRMILPTGDEWTDAELFIETRGSVDQAGLVQVRFFRLAQWNISQFRKATMTGGSNMIATPNIVATIINTPA